MVGSSELKNINIFVTYFIYLRISIMKNYQNKFDTDKSFVDSMVDETNESDLSDDIFTQACEEFGITEDEAMDLMVKSDKYQFHRIDFGWFITVND